MPADTKGENRAAHRAYSRASRRWEQGDCHLHRVTIWRAFCFHRRAKLSG